MNKQISFSFLGNCQASNLSEIAQEYGFASKFFQMSSTDVRSTHGIASAKEYLRSFLSEGVLRELLSTGLIRINPSRNEIEQFEADVFVYNLFHEASCHYIHKEKGFIITYYYSKEMSENTKLVLVEKLANDFNVETVDHEDYLERFLQFVKENYTAFPSSKHVVVERIKNSDVSSRARSYLSAWDSLQNNVDALYNKLRQLGVLVVNATLPLEKFLNHLGAQQLFPEKIKKKLVHEGYSFHTYLDIEHPRKEYWEFIFCSIINTEPSGLINEPNEFIKLQSALIQSIRSRNIDTFLSLLESLAPEHVNNAIIETLEAALYVFGKDVYSSLVNLLEKCLKSSDEKMSLTREKVCNLLSIMATEKVIDEISINDTIALWGAGGRCKILIEELKKIANIQCIFDSDPQKHGKFLSGIPIINPDSWKREENLKAIVVTTTYYIDVCRRVALHDTLAGVKLIDSTNLLDRLMAQQKAILV